MNMPPPTLNRLELFLKVIYFFSFANWHLAVSFSPSTLARFSRCRQLVVHESSAKLDADANGKLMDSRLDQIPGPLLIHWKGEDGDSFGSHFRSTELKGALAAILDLPFQNISLELSNALNYAGVELVNKPPKNVGSFNEALQYVLLPKYPRRAYIQAIERSSLVHALYEFVADAENFDLLTDAAMQRDGFDDMKRGGVNENASWCVRVRHFGESSGSKQDLLRHGSRTRSVTKEREACLALRPLLIQFGGKVDLKQPDVKIYLFDGLFRDNKRSERVVLTRRLASGPQISSIDPNTRICVTNTPLVPTAAFLLCNAACLRKGATILDPYAGSGTILLAAAMIEPSCRSVGIEIAHDGLVNREHIRDDFRTRGLNQPLGLLLGDCTDDSIRSKARALIGGEPFDCIISDPPYGIRESTIAMDPTAAMLNFIINDRAKGTPLLKKGGMLVCFIPCRDDERLSNLLPSQEQLARAGLRMCASHEQPLSKSLSRWLVSFLCYE